MDETAARRKRINRLKKIILNTIILVISILFISCSLLGIRVFLLKREVRELTLLLQTEREAKEAAGALGQVLAEESKPGEEKAADSESREASFSKSGKEEKKEVFLTFDDGPSSNTNAILDILQAYDVKATFFVLGKTDAASKAAYRRIVEEGHTLGMHSYSHQYEEIYASKENFIEDLTKLQEYLYEVTGVWPKYYRFPGGSSNTVSQTDMGELIQWLEEQGIIYFDWNAAGGDAVNRQLSAETLTHNSLEKLDSQKRCMILLHDAEARTNTVEALPMIITQVRKRKDACFLPVTDETEPIRHVQKVPAGNE